LKKERRHPDGNERGSVQKMLIKFNLKVKYTVYYAACATFAASDDGVPIMKEVTIVCDGSSLGNGKGNPRAAAAAALGYKGYWRAFGEYLGNATNQQAEIAAAAIGLEKLSEPCSVRVLTDSRYVVQTMQGNFRKKTNLEWWARIDRAAQKHQITWEWVKGHAGHDVQEVVDTLARKTAELGKVDDAMFDELIADIGVLEI
jgi:ribonuclease HI